MSTNDTDEEKMDKISIINGILLTIQGTEARKGKISFLCFYLQQKLRGKSKLF